MCLTCIISKDVKRTWGFGWKIFTLARDPSIKLRFEYRSQKQGLILNGWNRAINKDIVLGDLSDTYSSGYHILLSVIDALKYTWSLRYGPIYLVMYRKARVLGIQDGFRIIVTDEMRPLIRLI